MKRSNHERQRRCGHARTRSAGGVADGVFADIQPDGSTAEPSLILIVRQKRQVAERVVELILVRPGGGALPRWPSGAYVDLVLGLTLAHP